MTRKSSRTVQSLLNLHDVGDAQDLLHDDFHGDVADGVAVSSGGTGIVHTHAAGAAFPLSNRVCSSVFLFSWNRKKIQCHYLPYPSLLSVLLDRIFKWIYEDITSIINHEQFLKLSAQYETEQNRLEQLRRYYQ